MLARLAGGAITEDDAVTTLATLAQLGDLEDAFDRARSRLGAHAGGAAGDRARAPARGPAQPGSAQVGAPLGYEPLR